MINLHMSFRRPPQHAKILTRFLQDEVTESSARWNTSPLQGYRLHFVTITPLCTYAERNNMEHCFLSVTRPQALGGGGGDN